MTDSTSGFKALRVAALQRLDWKNMQAEGYGFQIELHFWLWQSGAIIREIPITFTERLDGTTKMTRAIAIEAALRVLQLAMYTLTRPAGANPHACHENDRMHQSRRLALRRGGGVAQFYCLRMDDGTERDVARLRANSSRRLRTLACRHPPGTRSGHC